MNAMACLLDQGYAIGYFYLVISYSIIGSTLVYFAGKKTNKLQLQANSDWLYIVPWGLYKAVTYVKEKYGNPTMFLSENGTASKTLSCT